MGAAAALALLLVLPTAPSVLPTPAPSQSPLQPVTAQPTSPRKAAPIEPSSNRQPPTQAFSIKPVSYQTSTVQAATFVENGRVYPLRIYKALAAPNDPNATQWWTTSTGLPAAWDYNGGAGQRIAIIDSGVSLDHQEFSGRWAINGGEQGSATIQNPSDRNCTERGLPLSASCNNLDDDLDGVNDNEIGSTTSENVSFLNCSDQGRPMDKSCNLIDDDNNGFADDVRGWDFSSHDRSVQPGQVSTTGTGTTHGTQVAGIAAATGNNGVGIAGVNWRSEILPLQALTDRGGGTTLSVGRAVRYAADRGATVINLSLGTESEDPYMREAIHYALSKGAVVVAAAGNDGCACMLYPAAYPEAVAVGASNAAGNPASFTSYGPNLDILAPGQDMRTTSWTSSNAASAYSPSVSGTSFAAPYISGLLAAAKSSQPTATWGQLVAQLHQQADRRTLSAGAPRNDTIGHGYARAGQLLARVNANYSSSIRYDFKTDTNDSLSSPYAGECEASNIPGMSLYQLKNGSSSLYTTSELSRFLYMQQGYSVTRQAYVCGGLPTDKLGTYRLLNPLSELGNL